MKISRFPPLILLSVLILIALPSCGAPKPGSSPKAADESEAMDFEPMTIERTKSPENIYDDMDIWDDSKNTNLVFKIHRVTTYEGSENITVEITTEIPLFAQEDQEAEGATFYGEGPGEATAKGGIPGTAYSEAYWDLEYWIEAYVEDPPCILQFIIHENWLEGEWCTTVLGKTNCEPAYGDEFKIPYGLVEFLDATNPIGPANIIDAINFTSGATTMLTEIEIARLGEGAINMPLDEICGWEKYNEYLNP